MPWSGTVDSAHKITQRVRYVKEIMTLNNAITGSVIGSLSRQNAITSETWIGIEQNTAVAYVQSQSTVSGIEDISCERANDAGAYTVNKDSITYGTWS